MRTITESPASAANFIDRALCQRLSRVAALVDKALSGPPAIAARDIDYRQRQRAIERDARRELRALRDALAVISLE